ncbi:2-oxoglutarate-dependent dioxygenase DAO [Tripterygium wilfordii]|uniref:2-oxoglutarate-dependent dioxygenase DAO n=1 Tax=Tripterygium wilfordii TaxID=458696 RepID=A0A7J7CQH1_TRIWF|nr:2-oxoglutarate-dependent dioxygenase DAO [Tripterygium wilfordii]
MPELGLSNHQRSVIEAYAQGINDLAMEILEKLTKTMGLSGYSFEGWPMLFRINKYHFIPEAVGTVGVQLHSDAVFLTLLQDDENVGGLEVINSKSGEYVRVDPGGSGGGTRGAGGRSASATLRSFYVGRVQEAPIHRQVSDH